MCMAMYFWKGPLCLSLVGALRLRSVEVIVPPHIGVQGYTHFLEQRPVEMLHNCRWVLPLLFRRRVFPKLVHPKNDVGERCVPCEGIPASLPGSRFVPFVMNGCRSISLHELPPSAVVTVLCVTFLRGSGSSRRRRRWRNTVAQRQRRR